MNSIKYKLYASAGLSLLAFNQVHAAIDATSGHTAGDITKGTPLVDTLQNWLRLILSLLYFIAVVYGLWGGFQILTAAGDEEKVTKGKKVLINAVIGIIVIFLSGMVMRFVIGLVAGQGTVAE